MPKLYYDTVWLAMLKKNQRYCNTSLVHQPVNVEPLKFNLSQDADYKWLTDKLSKLHATGDAELTDEGYLLIPHNRNHAPDLEFGVKQRKSLNALLEIDDIFNESHQVAINADGMGRNRQRQEN